MKDSKIDWHPFKEGDFPLERDSKIEAKKCRLVLKDGVCIDSTFKYIDGKPYFCKYLDGNIIVEWIPFNGDKVVKWSPIEE